MELFLMQHGQALAKEQDPQQPLSPEGVAQVQSSAAALKKLGLAFDTIICSPKKRSKQTAALVAEAVNYPYSDIVEGEAVKAMTPAVETLKFLQQYTDQRAVFIAGHLPSLGEIASALLTDGTKAQVYFENAGLCCLEVPSLPTFSAVLRYSLTAEQLRIIAG